MELPIQVCYLFGKYLLFNTTYTQTAYLDMFSLEVDDPTDVQVYRRLIQNIKKALVLRGLFLLSWIID